MKTYELGDNWTLSGTDYPTFEEALNDLCDSTYVVEGITDNFTLLSFRDKVGENKLVFNLHSKEQIEQEKSVSTHLAVSTLEKNCVDEGFLAELTARSKLLMRLGGAGGQREDIYFTSSRLSRDLAARARLGGDAVYDPTDERDMYIMSRYVKTPAAVKAVVRRNSGDTNAVHKVFAMPSGGYCHIDQRIILNIIAKLEASLGEAHCLRWHIDHFITQLMLLFPENAKDVSEVYGLPDPMVPGFLLETSDTGDCSVRVVGFWYRPGSGSVARSCEYHREHKGRGMTSAEILDAIGGSVLTEYTLLPERLCELLAIDLDDPEAALDYIFLKENIRKKLGKKAGQNLYERLLERVTERPSMTAYEMAMLFIDAPALYGIDDLYRVTVEEIAGHVPFLNFDAIAKTTTAISLLA